MPTKERAIKIDPEKQKFEEVPARLTALEEAFSEVQDSGTAALSERLAEAEKTITRLEQLLFHHHQQRPNQLNYVDKPVLIKDGSFVSIGDGPNTR